MFLKITSQQCYVKWNFYLWHKYQLKYLTVRSWRAHQLSEKKNETPCQSTVNWALKCNRIWGSIEQGLPVGGRDEECMHRNVTWMW